MDRWLVEGGCRWMGWVDGLMGGWMDGWIDTAFSLGMLSRWCKGVVSGCWSL